MGSNLISMVQDEIESCNNFSQDVSLYLSNLVWKSENEDRYSKPMLWIGVYIVVASLLCTLAIVADLLHGFRNKKLWFPCKYFTLNAASLTVIAVAMKLPMDLNNPMSGFLDRKSKLGSMAFLCAMIANSLPSLATMSSKELLANIIALDILVITMIVNVCIQIKTGVIFSVYERRTTLDGNRLVAIFYMVVLLMLLIIQICSALTIPKSKQILESKYQTCHETAFKDLELHKAAGKLNVKMLNQHVSNHWIMAGTGSPQFITACSTTTSASGVLCVASTVIHVTIIKSVYVNAPSLNMALKEYQSDYNWSIPFILMIQFIGSLLGTIAPLCRCYAALSFKFSIKWIWSHIRVLYVESYWTQMLCDWKQSSIPFSVSSRKTKIVIQNFKVIILTISIGLQMTVVVACKMIALVPIFLVLCVLCCIRCLEWVKAMFSATSIMSAQNPEQLENNNDRRRYVLQIRDDMEISERTLNSISKSFNRLIQKAEKQQPSNLMKLLKESQGFEGVGKYVSLHVPSLHAEEYLDCWSLPLVTLTAITISLPKIQNHVANRLLSSVSEGLAYVALVEEILNTTQDYVRIQKAAQNLWLEVEIYHKWLGNNLTTLAPPAYTTGQILQRFKNIAKNMVSEAQNMNIGSPNNNSNRSICADSMYRITETIFLSYHTYIDDISQEDLFTELSSTIAAMLAACLANLPQVIAMKCHESVIEKRESSVHAAALLLGETTQIINILQNRALPNFNPDEFSFNYKWCDYLQHP